jgi:hypothetical protein
VIPAAAAVLQELGVLGAGEAVRYHVGLTRGDTLWLDAFVGRGVFVHAKLAEFVTLRDEVSAYQEAWRTFAAFMPRPIGYRVSDGVEVFVTEGVAHRAAWTRGGAASTPPRALIRAICSFFRQASGAAAVRGSASPHAALLGRLQRRFVDSPLARVVDRWRSTSGLRELDALGATPQHGDFVVNNLGVAGSRFVVFDWEDFGKVMLPGLDLCTLVMSSAPADEFDRLAADGRPLGRPVRALVEPACEAIGIDVAQFRRLIPLYLLAFLDLKHRYATGIQRHVRDVLDRVCALAGP